MDIPEAAPTYEVPDREVVAVEHPMIIQNVEKAIKTFGSNRPFVRILESADPEQCIPLWLRQNDPMCVPILSHNSPTNNVLLKFTVPKRTGRKRKRGSDGPFLFPGGETTNGVNLAQNGTPEQSCLIVEKASTIFRKINDNVDSYQVAAVAEIRQTHRYRGLADFHHSTSNTEFGGKFVDHIVDGDIEKLKQFKFNPSRGWKPLEDFIPAPKMTVHSIPQNWTWQQNANIHRRVEAKTGKQVLVNVSKPRKFEVSYLKFDEEPVPMESPFEIPEDPNVQELIADLKTLFEERPIWSRRAIFNRLSKCRVRYLMKAGIQHVGYQFRGGPFRECVIKYGLDPRKDSKYRQFQTVFFKVYEDQRNSGMQWHDMRTTYSMTKKGAMQGPDDGHTFDGKKVTFDGKVWQLCDVSDPLLKRLIDNSPLNETFEISADGWYMNGSMAKIRGIMRTKIVSLWRKQDVKDEDFDAALELPDHVPGRKSSQIQVALPNEGMTAEDFANINQKGVPNIVEENGVRRRLHKGKIRTHRIRAKVGSQKAPTRRRRRKMNDTLVPANRVTKSGTAPGTSEAIDPGLTNGVAGSEDPNQAMEGSEEESDSGDEDDDIETEDDDDEDDQDDETGLENIAAPILKRPLSSGSASTGQSSRATTGTPGPAGSEPPRKKPRLSKGATLKPRKPREPKEKKPKGGSGSSSVNGFRYTPAPIDMSMFRNIQPRPPPT